MFPFIELALALLSYQDDHIVLPTLAGLALDLWGEHVDHEGGV